MDADTWMGLDAMCEYMVRKIYVCIGVGYMKTSYVCACIGAGYMKTAAMYVRALVWADLLPYNKIYSPSMHRNTPMSIFIHNDIMYTPVKSLNDHFIFVPIMTAIFLNQFLAIAKLFILSIRAVGCEVLSGNACTHACVKLVLTKGKIATIVSRQSIFTHA